MFSKAPDQSFLPPPKRLLHYVCFFCLVSWGLSATVVASHVGSTAAWFEWTRQIAMLSFFGLLVFGFFYAQYAVVERATGRRLNEKLAQLQVAGGAAVLLAAYVVYLAALISNDLQFGAAALGDGALTYIAILGEGVFIANVIVTYALEKGAPAEKQVIPISRPAAPVATTALPDAARTKAREIAAKFDWSASPTAIFGIAAAFFLLAGIFLIVKAPARMPLMKDGALTYVSSGYLWLPLALPFTVFAVVYWLIEIFTARTFDRSATRLHFVCTILAVLDAIRIYWSWSVTTSNMHSELPGTGDFFGVFAFLALATGALIWNIRASSPPRPASTPRPRTV